MKNEKEGKINVSTDSESLTMLMDKDLPISLDSVFQTNICENSPKDFHCEEYSLE